MRQCRRCGSEVVEGDDDLCGPALRREQRHGVVLDVYVVGSQVNSRAQREQPVGFRAGEAPPLALRAVGHDDRAGPGEEQAGEIAFRHEVETYLGDVGHGGDFREGGERFIRGTHAERHADAVARAAPPMSSGMCSPGVAHALPVHPGARGARCLNCSGRTTAPTVRGVWIGSVRRHSCGLRRWLPRAGGASRDRAGPR